MKPNFLPPTSKWHLCFNKFGLGCHVRSFSIYKKLFAHAQGQYPSLAHMSSWDFNAVLRNPKVGKAVTQMNGKTIALPLIGPAETDPLLSGPYYDGVAKETATEILHFFLIPGLINTVDDCPQGLMSYLASRRDKMAFSYVHVAGEKQLFVPVHNIAKKAGFVPNKTLQLSKQTFVTTQFHLQHCQAQWPPNTIMAGYRALEAEGKTNPKIRFKEILERKEYTPLWHMYEKKFLDVLSDHPYDQTMEKERFLEIMKDPAVVKMVAYDDKDRPCAMLTVGDVTAFAPEIDVPFFQKQHPIESAHGNLFYATTLFSDHTASQIYSRPLGRQFAAVAERAGNALVLILDVRGVKQKPLFYLIKKYFESQGKINVNLHEVGCLSFELICVEKGKRP